MAKKKKYKIHKKVENCAIVGSLDNGATFDGSTKLKELSQEDLEAYKRGLPLAQRWFVMGPAPKPLKRDNKEEEALPTIPEEEK